MNGYVAVDVVNHPWPDAMGDPTASAMIFCRWLMGHFGPFVYPGNLARAEQHNWAWEPARTSPDGHGGFIRVRTSYVFGGDKRPGPALL